MMVEGAAATGGSGVDSMMIADDWKKEPEAGIEYGAPHTQEPPAQHGRVCAAGA